MSNITKCDKLNSGLFLFKIRLDNKYTIKRESKTTGGDQVKNNSSQTEDMTEEPDMGMTM